MKKMGKALVLSTSILMATPLLPMTSLTAIKAEASTATIKMKKTAFQTKDRLNLRSGSSTKDKILLTIPKGKIVQATEKKGSWYKVSYTYKSKNKNTTKTGWVSSSFLKEYDQYQKISKTYYFTNKATKFYTKPNTKNKATYTVAAQNGFASTQKAINSLGETWYRISYKGKTLYVNSKDVSKKSFTSFSQTKYKANKNAYLYQSYGNAQKKLIAIPKGTIVQSKKRIGDWYSISYKGKNGYIFISDFTKYSKITYNTSKTDINYYITNQPTKLYSTPDTNGAATYTVAANYGFSSNEEVTNSLGETMYKITYNEETLYINSQDVTKATADSINKTDYKATKDTYLYQSFGINQNKLVKIPKGTIITTSERWGDWYSTSYKGLTGYVFIKDFSKYSKIKEQKIDDTTYVTTDALNIRKSYDASSTILTTIPKSKIVIASYKVSNGWFKIQYGKTIGYVNGKYLTQVRTGDPITNHTGYQFIDLRTKSSVTAAQINNYIEKYVKLTGKKSILTGKGQVFINAGNKYGVNSLYLAAHAIHESAYGTSLLSLGKNNLFGFGAYDATPFIAANKFNSVDECINYIAQEMKATYLNPNNWKYSGAYLGFSTKDMNNKRIDANSGGMNFWYASDPYWGKTIAKHMQNILPFDSAYYKKASVNTKVFSQPTKPEGSDIFPADIQAATNNVLDFYSERDTASKKKTFKKGTEFTLLEKTNDFWVKVKIGKTTYWTNSIKFDNYKKYISVKNLGRVTTSDLNVRSTTSTSNSKNIIHVLKQNEFVQIILTKDGKPTMDKAKGWYKIKLDNGKTGWISSYYITQELK
ncbi:SH3 domain-containing protein [Heyndrickxia vini]|uniref:SH3 domain-containing protein n=1 Tax=Heyndrickxia vini TaxID=1476025 RepID=A0ABX7DYU5_9BACI|nr:SH3 domain-containing protein [Heyndrickxia vini]QQZ08643.1 SH3 domain-containing protein [Heyndrickxia vini]